MRSLPDPGFSGDDGSADPAVAAALSDYAKGGTTAAVLAVVCGSRLLIPVVSMVGETETGEDGLIQEKSAEVAAVLMQRRDGRRALLAFTSIDALRAWNPTARPVPVAAADAARAARGEGATALLVDVAGPVRFVIETAELEQLAAGHVLARTSVGYAWLAPG